jgi:hypothetical protein
MPEPATRKRPAHRRGRWTYNSESSRYGVAGWHLDDSDLVIDWMPGHNAQCPHSRRCRGEYQPHNWPGREWESLACYVDEAMETVEREWGERILSALAGHRMN